MLLVNDRFRKRRRTKIFKDINQFFYVHAIEQTTQLVFSLVTGVLAFETFLQLLLGYTKTTYTNIRTDVMF